MHSFGMIQVKIYDPRLLGSICIKGAMIFQTILLMHH